MNISDAQVADFKEAFLLFDKDQDGVLSFPELTCVMKVLGIKISGIFYLSQYLRLVSINFNISILDSKLSEYVKQISEDTEFETVEFNEFLELVSKHEHDSMNNEALREAFR